MIASVRRCVCELGFRAVALSTLLVVAVAAPQRIAAADAPQVGAQIATPDPQHLWNRLRARLHVRTHDQLLPEADTVVLDPDEHDPLHWSRIWFPEPVDYLLTGRPYHEAREVLDEFLITNGEKLESDPLQRALLQHDLWALFDHLSAPEWNHRSRIADSHQIERRELYRRLATAIERLALTSEQIDNLPDNYLAAIAADSYAADFDPTQPDHAYLPSDLWGLDGPWVLVGEWASNPLAIRHTAFFGGRSTFVVFVRLPEGRQATIDYLKQLRDWKPPAGDSLPPIGRAVPPQVPAQTQFAIARRMMVINDSGDIVPTRVTESVQIRAVPDGPEANVQTALEFRLRRGDLLAGIGGGLSPVGPDEVDRSNMLQLGPSHGPDRWKPIMQSCRTCHREQGILSMNSYTGSMDNVSRLRGVRSLIDSTLTFQVDTTIEWKQQQYSWGLLTGLRESEIQIDREVAPAP